MEHLEYVLNELEILEPIKSFFPSKLVREPLLTYVAAGINNVLAAS